jgi:transmembrane sensor
MTEINWEILIAYLDGTSTESDKEIIELWLKSNSDAKEEFERMKKIWNVNSLNLPAPDVNQALEKVIDRIKLNDRRAQLFDIKQTSVKDSLYIRFSKSIWIRAAAIILISIGAIYIYLLTQNTNTTKLCQVAFNNIDSLTLNDGTKVILDAGSSLYYQESFANDERRVRLEGEAFFYVAKNPAAPFIIQAEKCFIKVLGTKFNVRAWKMDKEVIVAVEEGKVSFKSDSMENKAQEVILTAGKLSRLDSSGTLSEPTNVDIVLLKSWMKREFYFINTPLEKVISQLERWYAVKFEVSDSSLLQNRITVFIQNRPLEENIKLIAEVIGTAYDIKENVVKFHFP